MRFVPAYLLLGLIAVVRAAPLADAPGSSLDTEAPGSHLESRGRPKWISPRNEPNGRAVVKFLDSDEEGRVASHEPLVPQQIQTHVEDYFREKFPHIQCDVRFASDYKLRDTDGHFTILYNWEGQGGLWNEVMLGIGAPYREYGPVSGILKVYFPGSKDSSIATPHIGPVPERIQQRLKDYFHNRYRDIQCDIQYESKTAYMAHDVEAAFNFVFWWKSDVRSTRHHITLYSDGTSEEKVNDKKYAGR
ncbi:hypothetical protein GGU10DRAFT_342671 [Lentinula aff. detonsa]|uniref:Uncharacterized protein n=1 Tax=Lentinula aff. detonsa TaxID=2804958 RepID=A0AA38NRE3_9AGAR|nr:hypothetical protein GGU10DRAFT_342671 [Lentinula aff. detonsa]